jgi:hypothetical protein
MAKTILNSNYRERLNKMAAEFLTALVREKHKWETRRKALEKVVARRIKEEYPLKDMLVLEKYGKTERRKSIKLVNTADRRICEFELEVEGLFPKQGYSETPLGCDSLELVVYLDAAEAIKSEYGTRIEDYRALIRESRTLEDVEQVWPEATRLRKAVAELDNSRALIRISEPLIERIKGDVLAARKE